MPANGVFSGRITNLLPILCVLMEILLHDNDNNNNNKTTTTNKQKDKKKKKRHWSFLIDVHPDVTVLVDWAVKTQMTSSRYMIMSAMKWLMSNTVFKRQEETSGL